YVLDGFRQLQDFVMRQLGAAHLGGSPEDAEWVRQRTRPAPLPFAAVLVSQCLTLLEEFDLISKEKDGLALLVLSVKHPGRALPWTLINLEGITFQGCRFLECVIQGLADVGLVLAALPCPGQCQAKRNEQKCAHEETPWFQCDFQFHDNEEESGFHSFQAFLWTLEVRRVSLFSFQDSSQVHHKETTSCGASVL